jgi:hypothetical protein
MTLADAPQGPGASDRFWEPYESVVGPERTVTVLNAFRKAAIPSLGYADQKTSQSTPPALREAQPSGEIWNGMHIHQPKPLRSVREFLSEIGFIVVGIDCPRIGAGGEGRRFIRHAVRDSAALRGRLPRPIAVRSAQA